MSFGDFFTDISVIIKKVKIKKKLKKSNFTNTKKEVQFLKFQLKF